MAGRSQAARRKGARCSSCTAAPNRPPTRRQEGTSLTAAWRRAGEAATTGPSDDCRRPGRQANAIGNTGGPGDRPTRSAILAARRGPTPDDILDWSHIGA